MNKLAELHLDGFTQVKIFKELKKLGYIHYSATTIEELDDLPLNSAERISEQALVLRWFREKHSLRNSITDFIDDETGIEWDYEIAIIGTDVDEKGNYKPIVDYSTDDETRKFKTYEEAELACLRKLIEICSSK